MHSESTALKCSLVLLSALDFPVTTLSQALWRRCPPQRRNDFLFNHLRTGSMAHSNSPVFPFGISRGCGSLPTPKCRSIGRSSRAISQTFPRAEVREI
ncbi:hypothetical protein C8F04DRAFT_1108018 [Mycena alexandri]|uniref:Secreted protein n=1 Tax=Mycena alexandri TaxID=1745969 RepID=A0AAD6X4S4_9AGAR|nr:hypothetical protein C8F04DRAFT_1108018 [Mycena alexandri]